MRLKLINGYPFPYPQGLPTAESDAINDQAKEKCFEINGVVHFEWLHTLTVQFGTDDPTFEPETLTGWKWWDRANNVLEAHTSSEEGYGHPAIIVGDTAYCGFILLPE